MTGNSKGCGVAAVTNTSVGLSFEKLRKCETGKHIGNVRSQDGKETKRILTYLVFFLQKDKQKALS